MVQEIYLDLIRSANHRCASVFVLDNTEENTLPVCLHLVESLLQGRLLAGSSTHNLQFVQLFKQIVLQQLSDAERSKACIQEIAGLSGRQQAVTLQLRDSRLQDMAFAAPQHTPLLQKL